ncbi:hypothetical protein [Streptomyces sp. NPDC046197]|uniref:hypothetical protein n=1 Tax=Streptomyces sp. NPDC046197 TaxID=3154337 RepID=UPI0033ED0597
MLRKGRMEDGAASAARVASPGTDLQDERTVRRLRLGVGTIGLLLPPAIPLGNWLYAEARHQVVGGFWHYWPDSMSGSYYTSTRNVFVGGLCALGVFLIAYRFERREDRWSSAAGVCALGVAFFPTAPAAHASGWQLTVRGFHVAFAVSLLLVLAGFCLLPFRRRMSEGSGSGRAYWVAGWAIVGFVALSLVVSVTHLADGSRITPLYACEALSVWAFGTAWTLAAFQLARKGREVTPGIVAGCP